KLDVEFLDLPGERIPLADASVDTVVSTFSLCTIPGVAEAVAGIRRILNPGGKFIFFEHGLAPEPSVQPWHKRTEPLFRWVLEGCHVTCDIPDSSARAVSKLKRAMRVTSLRFPSRGRTAGGVWQSRTRLSSHQHVGQWRSVLHWVTGFAPLP